MNKSYKLEIPRNQFDRIADAFEHQIIEINSFDINKDTITFSVTENQRKDFAKYAVKKDNPNVAKKMRATYWITQMFLPRNIKQYEV